MSATITRKTFPARFKSYYGVSPSEYRKSSMDGAAQ